MKIFAAGDFHGTVPKKFRKYAKSADVILCVGDTANRDKERELIFKHWNKIRDGTTLYDFISPQKYIKIILEGIRSMGPVVKEIDGYGKPIYFVNGNGDFEKVKIKKYPSSVKHAKYTSFDELAKKSKHIKFVRYGIRKLSKEYEVLMCGSDEYLLPKEKRLLLKAIFSKRDKAKKQILLTHNVPFRTKIDIAGFGPEKGRHLGSREIAWAVKKYKPLLQIGGHIHESQGIAKVGKTICVNVGYGRKGQAAIIEFVGKKVKIKLLR